MRTFIVSVLCVCFGNSLTWADPPSVLNLFRKSSKVDAVEGSEYQLQVEDGPWLIYAFSFEGDDAVTKANELVFELRSEFNLEAYILQKTFDHSERVRGIGFDDEGQEKVMKYRNGNASTSAAVLVGNFPSADSPELKRSLQILKTATPKCLGGAGSSTDTQQGIVQALRNRISASKVDGKPRGPMAMSMATKNPLLPDDFFQPPPVDSFLTKLNRDKAISHSLLDCPGKFTVRIAEFRGRSTILGARSVDNELSDALQIASQNANDMTRVLRSQGLEAYEFHYRESSIVTIGSFDAIGAVDAEGNFQYTPDIQRIILQFGGVRKQASVSQQMLPIPKTLLDVVHWSKIPELTQGTEKEKMVQVQRFSIPFDLQPAVIATPRPDKGRSLYSGSLLGRGG